MMEEMTKQGIRQASGDGLGWVERKVSENREQLRAMTFGQLNAWIHVNFTRYSRRAFPQALDAIEKQLGIDFEAMRDETAEQRRKKREEKQKSKRASSGFYPPWVAVGNAAESERQRLSYSRMRRA